MKYLSLLAIGVVSLLSGGGTVAAILPYPNQIEWRPGVFRIGKDLRLCCDAFFKDEVQKTMGHLSEETGLSYRFSKKEEADCSVAFSADVKPEGYTLEISESGINVGASTQAGLFYALETLKQLCYEDDGYTCFPCVYINDFPAFSWRGFLLDEARNFQGKEEVKKLIDEMAALKMNVFHWHLTDDQGWRIEIKKYPLLTEVGGRRDSTQLNWYESCVYDGKPVSGYYTQQDIREIVAYAADRHITIVPEIEFPGHASAAIAAYPWLGCSGEAISVPCSYGVFSSVFNIGDVRVRRFIHDVLDEVSDLFPSKVIHIGGDEVKYDEWQNSESIQRFMQEEQLLSPAELQIWLANDLSSYLSRKGKVMMGWNDITGDKIHAFQPECKVESKLDTRNTIVQFWQGDSEILEKALERGFKVVNSQCDCTYLNYNYDKIVPGLEYGHTPIPMEKAYSFCPVPQGVDCGQDLVLGLTCAMWGEWINRPEIMYRMVYPQIAAYAEVGWTLNGNKDFDRFQNSLNGFEERWRSAGYIQ